MPFFRPDEVGRQAFDAQSIALLQTPVKAKVTVYRSAQIFDPTLKAAESKGQEVKVKG